MAKAVVSIRLEKAAIDAIDQVGLQVSRSKLVETILEIFLEQDFATQRTVLRQALMIKGRDGRADD